MFTAKPGTIRKRHQLLREGAPAIPKEARIKTVKSLRQHLQTAIELEHSTIPPYLCALYSIEEGSNPYAAQVIKSVVMEEMLHMILASNVLNAIGGKPSINHSRFIPEYPTYLPHSDKAFMVNLEKFSPKAVETFLNIERPAAPDAPPEPDNYQTIGQFYEAIEQALIELSQKDNIFTGEARRQITPEYYYGGGGGIIAITENKQPRVALEKALAALREIVGQGEGVHHTIFDGDHRLFGEEVEYAHYFRFNEIKEGRYYTNQDTPLTGPTGKPFPVDYKKVYNMRPNPKMKDYPRGSEVRQKMLKFNRIYMSLLNDLHTALNGQPETLMNGVIKMYDLKYEAVELMKIPVGKDGATAGPSFEYVTLKER
jgi:hypothetical protein